MIHKSYVIGAELDMLLSLSEPALIRIRTSEVNISTAGGLQRALRDAL